MRAIHKYRHAANQGNPEAQRRINQSLGYRISLADMPHIVELMERAGIMVDTIDMPVVKSDQLLADTTTLTL